jgi:hypothetical protein
MSALDGFDIVVRWRQVTSCNIQCLFPHAPTSQATPAPKPHISSKECRY